MTFNVESGRVGVELYYLHYAFDQPHELHFSIEELELIVCCL